MSRVTILIGAQWGDEGKGKWVDFLAAKHDLIARFQGGNNAGHTLYVDGKKVVLHQLPSGIFHKNKTIALLSGVVVNPVQLISEISAISSLAEISPEVFYISQKCHLISPYHILTDSLSEGASETPIGTTKRGIGPTYRDKIDRIGLRMASYCRPDERSQWIETMLKSSQVFQQSWEENQSEWEQFQAAADQIAPFVCDAENRIRKMISAKKSLLLEGAQGTLLDINHGTYPFVTSSNTTSGGAIASLGLNPRHISQIIGIGKAYVTRVGEGPFPTELTDHVGKSIAEKGHEFGATTNRPRRCGWFDAVAMRYSVQINGFDQLIINKMDILDGLDEIKIAVAYEHPTLGKITDFPEDTSILKECTPVYEPLPGWKTPVPTQGQFDSMPSEALNYLKKIEDLCGVCVSVAGTGPGRNDYLTRPELSFS